MKKFMMFGVWLVAFGASVGIAGPRVGNGGGAWLCRDHATLDIRWMKLTDVFEAEVEFGLRIPSMSGQSAWQKYDHVVAGLVALSPRLSLLIEKHGVDLRKVIRQTPAAGALAVINDGLYRVRPSASSCEQGYIYFAQIANFTDDGRLLISGPIWSHPSLAEIDRAALLIHELIYKVLREGEGDRNSLRTRQLVGILLSDLSADVKSEKIEAVLNSSAPPGEESAVALNPSRMVCAAKVTGHTIEAERHILMRSGQRLRGRIGTFSFHVLTNAGDGRPVFIEIQDSASGSSTLLDSTVLVEAFQQNRAIELKLRTNGGAVVAALNCWTETAGDVSPR